MIYWHPFFFKVAAAKPAVDSTPPKNRSHIEFKSKKALRDKQRQIEIFQENMRILNKTANIMSSTTPMYGTRNSGPNSPSEPVTLVVKKNYRIIFQWFLRKFGQYAPWWSQINY